MVSALDMDVLLALAVLLLAFVGLCREWGPPEVIAITGSAVLLAFGVLDTSEFLGVFSNSGPLTIGALFIVSGALQSTGVIELLRSALRRVADDCPPLLSTAGLLLGVMVASAFLSNTAVVVILAPVVISLSKRLSRAPSRLLIPLSYASILGGTCTLIGTSTNLLVNGVATDNGLEPFHMFELTGAGAIAGLAGLAYILLFGRKLLPERGRETGELEDAGRKRFLTELVITSSSDLVAKSLRKLEGTDSEIVEVRRGGEELDPASEPTFEPGDRIVIRAPAGEAVHLRDVAGASSPGEGDPKVRRRMRRAGFEIVHEAETMLREGIVGPGSQFEGRAVGSLNLRRLYDVRILAVHRHGEETRAEFEKIQLQVGDSLLLEGPATSLKRLFDTQELVSLSEPVLHRFEKEKAPIAIAAIGALVMLAAVGAMPVAALALIAAAVVLATGCLRPREAYEAIDWRILFLLFGMLGIGRALDTSGAIELLVEGMSSVVADLHPWLVLGIVYLFCSLLTELVTNNVVAIVVTPIAIGLAQQLGVDPRAFAVAVMFAGSASFATPLGYQTNTFVYGAGSYRFSDFLKVGVPLNLLTWIIATALIPLFWPLD